MRERVPFCRACGAPEGAGIFRKISNPTEWTAQWSIVNRDKRYRTRRIKVVLRSVNGVDMCQLCAWHEEQKETEQ